MLKKLTKLEKVVKKIEKEKFEEKTISLNLKKKDFAFKKKVDFSCYEIIEFFSEFEQNFLRNIFDIHHSNKEKLDQIFGIPITTGTLEELFDDDKAIISTNNGPEFYVDICSFVNKNMLTIGDSVLLHGKSLSIIGIVKENFNPLIKLMKVDLVPTEDFGFVGGLSKQIKEIKEVIELPLNHPEIFFKIGIIPPKGVILYGEPGTGKTLLAKAVANRTKANFFRIAGSELVQKYLGEGPKLVREIFNSASTFIPSIIFIDEIDAIGTIRFNSSSGGEREIQRTMLELLNQLDGFDARENIKVIMATNRIDTLDPALIRPGRIDRKIEFPYPDQKTLIEIFKIHTKRMKFNKKFKYQNFLLDNENFSGADVKAICTEAALIALRNHRLTIEINDLKKAKNSVLNQKKEKFFNLIFG
jgi:26S proteasome regulatory subunit T2